MPGIGHQAFLRGRCHQAPCPVMNARNGQTAALRRTGAVNLKVQPFIGSEGAMKPDAAIEA